MCFSPIGGDGAVDKQNTDEENKIQSQEAGLCPAP